MFMRNFIRKIMRIINRKTKRKQKARYYFEDQELFKLDECTYCALMPEEEKAWEELKQHLKDNSISVWCTFYGWDNFLNRTIFTGNVHKFINYLDSFVEKFPSHMYHLTDGGELRRAIVVE